MVPGNRLDPENSLRNLVAPDFASTKLPDFVDGGGAFRARHHGREDHLAPGRVGQAKHRNIGNPGMILQHRLNLARIDIFCAGFDQLFQAALEKKEALFVQGPQVARVDPITGIEQPIRFIVSPIAGRNRTAHHNFPHSA